MMAPVGMSLFLQRWFTELLVVFWMWDQKTERKYLVNTLLITWLRCFTQDRPSCSWESMFWERVKEGEGEREQKCGGLERESEWERKIFWFKQQSRARSQCWVGSCVSGVYLTSRKKHNFVPDYSLLICVSLEIWPLQQHLFTET